MSAVASAWRPAARRQMARVSGNAARSISRQRDAWPSSTCASASIDLPAHEPGLQRERAAVLGNGDVVPAGAERGQAQDRRAPSATADRAAPRAARRRAHRSSAPRAPGPATTRGAPGRSWASAGPRARSRCSMAAAGAQPNARTSPRATYPAPSCGSSASACSACASRLGEGGVRLPVARIAQVHPRPERLREAGVGRRVRGVEPDRLGERLDRLVEPFGRGPADEVAAAEERLVRGARRSSPPVRPCDPSPGTVIRSADPTLPAISCRTSITSARLRSYDSAQRCASVRASMSWRVTRMRSPERCTEPSSTWSTPRVSAICGMVSPFPASAMTEVREMTLSPRTPASCAISSSVSPSLRNAEPESLP